MLAAALRVVQLLFCSVGVGNHTFTPRSCERMVRDVFPVSGFLCFDAVGSVVTLVLNQDARLARSLAQSLRALLTPLHIVVRLGQT